MKAILLLLMFAMGMETMQAQQYTVRRDSLGHTVRLTNDYKADQPPYSHIDRSGLYLHKSANCQFAALGFSALSGLSFFIAGNNTDNRAVFNTVGVLAATSAVISQFLSITYKSHAGTELRLSASGLAVIF